MKLTLSICLVLFPWYLFADEIKFDDWVTERYSNNKSIEKMAIARTSNELNHILGIMCLTGNAGCHAFFNNRIACDSNGRYSILASADSSVVHIEVGCVRFADEYLLTLPDEILNVLLSHNNFGISYGEASGKFVNSYFSLKGSSNALQTAKKFTNIR